MSLFRREHYELMIDSTHWSIVKRAKAGAASFEYAHRASGDFFSMAEQESFREVCANLTRTAKAAFHVTFMSALSKGFSFKPPAGTRSVAELRTIAAGRFEQLFGEIPTNWVLEGQWHANHPVPVCALPRVALETLMSATGALRVDVPSLSASWPRALPLAARKTAGYVGIAETNSTTFLLHDSEGRITDVRIHLANSESTHEQSTLLLERQMLVNGSDPSIPVVWTGNAQWLGADMLGRSPAWWAS